jgi:hypothetical protein
MSPFKVTNIGLADSIFKKLSDKNTSDEMSGIGSTTFSSSSSKI